MLILFLAVKSHFAFICVALLREDFLNELDSGGENG